MDVPVYNMQGEQVGTMPIDEQALGGEINAPLIKQAYVVYHANRRQGSARSRGRSEVSGSTSKIYRQKGTGRARHGDKKPPQFRGGGHYKARRQTREDFRLSMPKKMKRKANRNALLSKALGSEAFGSELRVVEKITMPTPKTKVFSDFLAALKINATACVALPVEGDDAEHARRSARNLDNVRLCRADQMTCWDMLNSRFLVIEKAELEAWLTGPSSQTGKDAKTEPQGAGNGAREPRAPRAYKAKPGAGKRATAKAGNSDGGAS